MSQAARLHETSVECLAEGHRWDGRAGATVGVPGGKATSCVKTHLEVQDAELNLLTTKSNVARVMLEWVAGTRRRTRRHRRPPPTVAAVMPPSVGYGVRDRLALELDVDERSRAVLARHR